MDLGGATIIFSQNWNFELKFVLVNPLWEKMTSRWFWIYFLSKYGSKMPKFQTILQQLLIKKTFQNVIFQGQKLLKTNSQLELQFVFQITIQKSHFGTFSYLVVAVKQSSFRAFLTHIWTKNRSKTTQRSFFSKNDSPTQISAQNSNFEQK